MKLLRRLFGVSWQMHQAHQKELRESRAITETLKKAKSGEVKSRLRFEALYTKERDDHNACAKARQELQTERQTLMEINRNLAKELRRVRDLFQVTFTSKRAKKLALETRDLELRHLRQLTGGGHKFTAKHIALALALAKREQESKERAAEAEKAAHHAETGA